jgi:rubrerythrin
LFVQIDLERRKPMAVFTAAEALNMALRAEQNGEAFYTAAAGKAKDPQVKALLEDLAAQERKHYRMFQKLAKGVGDAPVFSAPEWEEYNAYLQSALDNALFSGPNKALAAAEGLEDERDALRMALGFEKDTMLFYYDLRGMVGEADRKVVDEIIREEKRHAQRLGALLRAF